MKDIPEAQAKIRKAGKIWTFSPSWCLPPETAARTMAEAAAVQMELDQVPDTLYKWHIEQGPKDWRTQKPLCYLVKAELKA